MASRSPVETNNPELQAGPLGELFRRQKYAEAEKTFHRLAENAGRHRDGMPWPNSCQQALQGINTTEGRVSVAAEARFYEAECLYQQSDYPKAADTYVRMLNDYGLRDFPPPGRDATPLLDRNNYWLDDTRQEMEKREKTQGQALGLSGRARFTAEKTKPFSRRTGPRPSNCLEAVRFNDIRGPLADQSLFLMGGVKLFNEDYREADYYYTDIVEHYPERDKAASALSNCLIFSKQIATGDAEILTA